MSNRLVSSRVCMECNSGREREYRKDRKSKIESGELPQYYYSSKPCPSGHIGLRATLTNSCVQCTKDAGKEWKSNNKDRVNAYQNDRRKNNPEIRKKWLAAMKKHQKDHPAYWCAVAAKRRAAKLQRTPAWADFRAIAEIYEESARLTEETGILHHVDHDIPLQGEFVSGLHCETNLVILTAADNLSKGNKHT